MASSVFNIGRGLYISNAVRRRMAECHRGPGVLYGVLAVAVAVAIHSTISKFRVHCISVIPISIRREIG